MLLFQPEASAKQGRARAERSTQIRYPTLVMKYAFPSATAAMLAALSLSSCASNPRTGPASPRVYWMGTPEYKAQEAKMSLSYKEAEKRLTQFYPMKPRPFLKAWEAALVDDWYHLEGPREADICLGGIYIHGMTGAIEGRTATHDPLRYRGQPTSLRWVDVEKLQGPIGQGKAGEVRDNLRRKAERSFPTGFFMPSRTTVESKLPEGGELGRMSELR